jgi:predicted DNA-binding transcriptional regulator YafY
VLPKPLRRRVEAVGSMSVAEAFGVTPALDAETLSTVALACRDQVQLGFDYVKAGAEGDAQPRLVEPLRLVPVGRRWYLVAFDLDRFDWRTFRLDRMSAVRATTRAFRPRRLPGDDPAAFVRDGLSRTRTEEEVVALVALDADVVRERVGRWASVTATARGTEVTMRYSLNWVLLALGMLDADYEFLSIPDGMLRELRGISARAQRALFLADSA